MNSIIEILKSKGDFESLGEVSPEHVDGLETSLDLTFAEDYKKCILEFGIFSVNGHEITGACKSKRLNVA